jgi:hypothetical protein
VAAKFHLEFFLIPDKQHVQNITDIVMEDLLDDPIKEHLIVKK